MRWGIERGVLVAPPGVGGDGYLEIDLRRTPTDDPEWVDLHVEVEVANYYPAIASAFTNWAYAFTQSRIHVLVTYGFLRSLAKLDLEESKIGRFADIDQLPDPSGPRRASVRPAATRAARQRDAALISRSARRDQLAQLVAVVGRADAADRARARAHDERLRRRDAGALVAHALQHVAVGDAGRREEAVVAARPGRPG